MLSLLQAKIAGKLYLDAVKKGDDDLEELVKGLGV